jgi:hypothetical protein
MTRDQIIECMHAVLDGTATPEQSMLLSAVLASDAEAAEEFEAWKALFAGLAALPSAEPPAGLVDRIAASLPDRAVPPEQIFVAGVQLPARPSVVAGGQGQTTRLPPIHPAIFQRPTRPVSQQEHRHMNVTRKVWAGGAIVVVALGVAILVSGYPPKEENVLGTVVPAERYRAPQAGAESVKLGEPAAATPTASTNAIQTEAQKAQMAADQKTQMAADQKTQVVADQKTQVAADQKAQVVADQKAQKAADQKTQIAADQKAQIAADQKAQIAADQKAQIAADQKAQMMANQKAQIAADQKAQMMANQKAQIAADQKAQMMADQKAQKAVTD